MLAPSSDRVVVTHRVTPPLTRIISDLHYGDRASQIKHLEQIAPLLDGATRVIFNGDTIDTRISSAPETTAPIARQLREFLQRFAARHTLLTGNHDPDISALHYLEFPGDLFVTHGDIFFDNIVPWGRDALLAEELVRLERQRDTHAPNPLSRLFCAHRRACAAIPQRHQAERHRLRHLAGLLGDTLWPPTRIGRIINSWRTFPRRAQQLLDDYQLNARLLVCGHTHWPGICRQPNGRVFINTGSFCPPCGQLLVEFDEAHLVVRRVRRRRGDYHPDHIVAEFALTLTPISA